MPQTPTMIRRAVQVLEFGDGDCIVTDDRYCAQTGKRTARAVYRTSALPAGAPGALERYLLADQLPAVLAVAPDIVTVVTDAIAQDGHHHVSLWRSLPGDTAADVVGTSTTPMWQDAATRIAELIRS